DRGVIAHRVVAINSPQSSSLITCLITRGDASNCGDELVEADQILGKVVAVERHGRGIKLEGKKAQMSHAAHMWAARLRKIIRHRLAGISEQEGLKAEL